MKKAFVLPLMAALMLLLTACNQNPVPNTSSTEFRGYSQASYIDMPSTLQDIACYSSHIVKAKLTSMEDFNSTIFVYCFEVSTDYTANTPDLIHVYDAYSDAYRIGHEYYLFLSSKESALYPHTIFTTAAKDLIIDAKSSKAKTSINGNDLTVKQSELSSSIKNWIADGIVGTKATAPLSVTNISDLSKINNSADIVAEVRITAETNANIYVSTYAVDVVSIQKGNAAFVPSAMNLPPALDQSKTYFVFLKEAPDESGTYSLFSRAYPVIDTASESAKFLLAE